MHQFNLKLIKNRIVCVADSSDSGRVCKLAVHSEDAGQHPVMHGFAVIYSVATFGESLKLLV